MRNRTFRCLLWACGYKRTNHTNRSEPATREWHLESSDVCNECTRPRTDTNTLEDSALGSERSSNTFRSMCLARYSATGTVCLVLVLPCPCPLLASLTTHHHQQSPRDKTKTIWQKVARMKTAISPDQRQDQSAPKASSRRCGGTSAEAPIGLGVQATSYAAPSAVASVHDQDCTRSVRTLPELRFREEGAIPSTAAETANTWIGSCARIPDHKRPTKQARVLGSAEALRKKKR